MKCCTKVCVRSVVDDGEDPNPTDGLLHVDFTNPLRRSMYFQPWLDFGFGYVCSFMGNKLELQITEKECSTIRT